jgi:hypothetical protein
MMGVTESRIGCNLLQIHFCTCSSIDYHSTNEVVYFLHCKCLNSIPYDSYFLSQPSPSQFLLFTLQISAYRSITTLHLTL